LDSAAGNLFEMYDSDGDGYMTKLDFFEFLYEFGKTFLTDKQVYFLTFLKKIFFFPSIIQEEF